MAIAAILLEDLMEDYFKIFATSLLVFGYSIPGLCSSTVYEKDKWRLFSIIGMSLALVACLYSLCFVWGILELEYDSIHSFNWNMAWTLNLLCWSCGHIASIMRINNENKTVSIAKKATIICSIIIDVMILIMLWNIFKISDLYERLVLVLGVLISLGTVGTPILNKIYNSKEKLNNVAANTNNNSINNSINNITNNNVNSNDISNNNVNNNVINNNNINNNISNTNNNNININSNSNNINSNSN